jgi:DNA-binding transcriptional MerR regulator
MTKAPLAFRTISEVSETLDVPQHVLRFWEGKFSQIKPLKRAGGRRYYRPEDIELLRGVRTLLYAEGYTIKGVQKVLRDSGARFVCEIGRYGLHRPGRGERDSASPVQAIALGAEADEGNLVTDVDAAIDEDIAESFEAPEPRDNGEEAEIGARRKMLEAALQELLSLRDLLQSVRPKRARAA